MTTYESATAELMVAIDRVIEPWLESLVHRVVAAHGREISAEAAVAARAAAGEGRIWVAERLGKALNVDVDAQRLNPLQILREAVRFPTRVLNEMGIPIAARDEFDQKINPDDVYGIGPAHWNDIDDSLTEPGIVWGAAKASTVLQRRRAEGKLDPS